MYLCLFFYKGYINLERKSSFNYIFLFKISVYIVFVLLFDSFYIMVFDPGGNHELWTPTRLLSSRILQLEHYRSEDRSFSRGREWWLCIQSEHSQNKEVEDLEPWSGAYKKIGHGWPIWASSQYFRLKTIFEEINSRGHRTHNRKPLIHKKTTKVMVKRTQEYWVSVDFNRDRSYHHRSDFSMKFWIE